METELSPLLIPSTRGQTQLMDWQLLRSANHWRWGVASVLITFLGVSSVLLGIASYKNVNHKEFPELKSNTELMAESLVQIFQAGFSLFGRGGVIPSRNNVNKFLNATQEPNMFPWMTLGLVGQALDYGNGRLLHRLQIEQTLKERGITLDSDSSMGVHQRFMKLMPRARKLVNFGVIKEGASYFLRKNMNLSSEDVHTVLPLLDWTGSYLFGNGDIPDQRALCWAGQPFRRPDGTCNNLQNPKWGAAFFPFRRLIKPVYADGISKPRMAKSGKPLPNARLVSTFFFKTKDGRDSPTASVFSMLWGLFIDHDITSTAGSESSDGTPITCCHPKLKDHPELKHPECYEIEIDPLDPFYSQFNITCLEFLRSGHGNFKTFGPRQQMNQITSFLDGSGIYGPSLMQEHTLRTHKGGELINSTVYGEENMMQNKNSSCGQPEKQEFCFISGDFRSNEQVQLTTVHTMWFREHNRVARALSKMNPEWGDERIIQEARRLVTAQLQHVTYNEYLPLVLGEEQMSHSNLRPQKRGYFDGYRDSLDPTISNIFTVAAFRFGHNQVRDLVDFINFPSGNSTLKVRDAFLNPTSIYDQGVCPHYRGMLQQSAKDVSSFITRELRDFTFKGPKRDFGTDLSSLTLQRSRDHGIAGYPMWRQHCGLDPIDTWEDLAKVTDGQTVNKLIHLYEHVSDIDFSVGSVLEAKAPGALVGPTYACIIAEQFQRLRLGDRFWYEASNQPYPFTPEQLQAIRNVSIARLLCDNTIGIDMIQPLALRLAGKGNELMNCSDTTALPRLDLSLWRSSGKDIFGGKNTDQDGIAVDDRDINDDKINDDD